MKDWANKHPALILFVLVITIGLAVSSHIGVAWDEPDNIYVGGTYWKFWQSGFDKKIVDSHTELTSYFAGKIFIQPNLLYPLGKQLATVPPVPNYLGTLLVILAEKLGLGSEAPTVIAAFHWASAIFFGLLVATVYRLSKLLGLTEVSSLFAAAVSLLYPMIFGYGFSDLKDIAQVSLFVMTLYYLVRSHGGERGKDLLIGGVLWGLALATKFNAIYVPIIWALWLFFQRAEVGSRFLWSPSLSPLARFIPSAKGVAILKNAHLPARLHSILFIIAIGILVVFLVWPYLWFDPIGRGLEVVGYFTSVGKGFAVWWNGQLYRVGGGHVLWWYPWANLLVSTPLPLLALGVIGGIRVIRGRKKYGILLIWLVVPMLRAILPGATFYDGLRHFLEVLPAFILLSAIGFEALFRLWPKTAGVVAVGTLLHLFVINSMLFPYSSGYYNVLARSPNENFDRDIEALSIKEAMDYLHHTYGPLRVWVPIGGHLSWYLIRPEDRYVYYPESADSIILVNKSSHIRRVEFETRLGSTFLLDHTISRGDAVFAWIYRRFEWE